MFEDIKNKRVLITGASGGMGIAMARIFAEYGARLGLHYQSNKKRLRSCFKKYAIKKEKRRYSKQIF